MKKLYFLPFLFWAITGFAQKQFVVQSGTAQTFDDLNEAIAAASAGDTIYLPGGGFPLTAEIDKTLHWRGVGHYPDSTTATGHTQITTSATFRGNCDNSTFEGIYFQDYVQLGSNNNECTGVTMKRCRIGGSLYLRSTSDVSAGNPDLNFRLIECVTNTIEARFGMNARIEKNLIFSTINNFNRSYFNHNAINDYDNSSSYDVINSCTNCQFSNNVFGYHYGLQNSANCNFTNNIFQSSMPYDPHTSTFTGSGNVYNTGLSIYKSIADNNYTFNYANDYHLNPDAAGIDEYGNTGVSIIGTATDGTNAGIYGTSLPYKAGAVPYQPHIQSAAISNQVVAGDLDVQIKVAAQER